MSATPHVVVLCDRYPELSETFIAAEVAALRRAGVTVSVEAVAEPARRGAGPGPVRVWERETRGERARALLWLAGRHPLGCLRDVAARRRWRRDEDVPPLRMLAPAARRIERLRPVHVHAHFAAQAALSALRIGSLLGVRFSVTAHAFDIYQRPANLAEKLRRSAFATSGCDYTVAELRRLAGPGHADRVHRIVMGVDGAQFERATPHAAGTMVLAVGRLVEKKGFSDLVEAVRLMRDAGRAPARVTIAGDGPLMDDLRAQVEQAGLAGLVELAGPVEHERVKALLEEAAVLCMPCVVAADGDRDSMPVVVKEALAMEVPVVATAEVGLPEVVRPPWGELVSPHDPAALALALGAELERPVAERATRGAAGRAFVLAECDVDAEARRLAALIALAAAPEHKTR